MFHRAHPLTLLAPSNRPAVIHLRGESWDVLGLIMTHVAIPSFTHHLQAEEQRLVQNQTEKAEDTGVGTVAADDAGRALATINGQEDVLILSSSVLQVT